MIPTRDQNRTPNNADRHSLDKSSNISTTTIVVIPQHRDPQCGMSITREDTACRTCGVIWQHVIEPGAGPHPLRLVCQGCERFIKWISAKSPEEREQAAAMHREAAMAGKPVTPRQLELLEAWRYRGPMPKDRLEASQKIDQLLASKGVRR